MALLERLITRTKVSSDFDKMNKAESTSLTDVFKMLYTLSYLEGLLCVKSTPCYVNSLRNPRFKFFVSGQEASPDTVLANNAALPSGASSQVRQHKI